MAACYNFEEDESPEEEDSDHLLCCPKNEQFIPESKVEIVDNNYDTCTKNPGHATFIRASDFDLHHLPEEYRTEENVMSIRNRCNITVKIRVSYTSPARPDTFTDINDPYPACDLRGKYRRLRYGTGIINRVACDEIMKKPCPCHICEASGDPKTECLIMIVRTATHVIYDDSEAIKAKFDCFYDSDDGVGMRTLYGLCMVPHLTDGSRYFRSDACEVMCATHETDLLLRLRNKQWSPIKPIKGDASSNDNRCLEAIVSHPHGWSKRITLGYIHYLTVPIKPYYKTSVPIPFKNGTLFRIASTSLETSQHPLHFLTRSASETTSKSQELGANITDIDLSLSFSKDLFHTVLTENTHFLASTFSIMIEAYEKAFEELKINVWDMLSSKARCTHFSQNEESCDQQASTPEEDLAIQALMGPDLQSSIPMPLFQDHSIYNPQDVILQTFIDMISQYKRKLISNLHVNDDITGPGVDTECESELGNQKEAVHMDMKINSIFYSKQQSEESEDIAQLNSARDDCVASSEENKKAKVISNMFMDWVTQIISSCLSDLEAGRDDVTVISDRTRRSVEKMSQSFFTHSTRGVSYGKSCEVAQQSENEFLLPPEMKFILPQDAEYALRYCRGQSGWFILPPETILAMPDGTYVNLPNETEFKNELLVPKLCYVTYDMDTCPSSSGATVFCNWLRNPDLTYFPHSGSLLIEKKNRSGVLKSIPLLKLDTISKAVGELYGNN